jgi:hypothetical protein
MLLSVPVLAFLGLYICLRLRLPTHEWRHDLVRAALVWAAIAIWLTEVLSLSSHVHALELALGWLAVGLVAFAISGIWRSPLAGIRFPRRPANWDWLDWTMAAAILLIASAAAVVALRSPPQTWDTLNYHMPRLAHWAQMAAVRPYVTGIEIQNSMPPGAEILFLQPYILANGDTWVNIVDWAATMVTLAGVSLLAKQLGAGRRGQLLAALFAATLPMAIIQASSTMTDVVLALWLVGVSAEVLTIRQPSSKKTASYSMLALGAGLAIVTKPTAFAYLLPFGVWAAVLLARERPISRAAGLASLGLLLIFSINAGYFSRNLRLYGNPIAPANRISELGNPWLGGRAFVSNLLRNATYQLSTPSPYVNKAIVLSVMQVHRWMGLGASDPRTTAVGNYKISLPTTSEDLAQNPVQMLMILAGGICLILRRRDFSPTLSLFALAIAGGFLMFSLIYKWQVFGSRYLLPFFFLAAPIIGVLAARKMGRTAALLLTAVLVLASLPWLLGIETRPLLARDPNGSFRSILTSNRVDLYFANAPYLKKPYSDMTTLIKGAGCRKVGLMLSGAQAEYPLWPLLGAPASNLELEWLAAGTPSEAYARPDFSACAIIRESHQPFSENLSGLPLAYRYGSFGLYLDGESSGN